MEDEFVDQFADTLRAMPETDARLEEIPPGFTIATGHDDDVMVFGESVIADRASHLSTVSRVEQL